MHCCGRSQASQELAQVLPPTHTHPPAHTTASEQQQDRPDEGWFIFWSKPTGKVSMVRAAMQLSVVSAASGGHVVVSKIPTAARSHVDVHDAGLMSVPSTASGCCGQGSVFCSVIDGDGCRFITEETFKTSETTSSSPSAPTKETIRTRGN